MSRRNRKPDPRQLDMFEKPRTPAYARGSKTSKAAAKSFKAPTLPAMRVAIVGLVEKAGERGRTCDELEGLLNLRHQTCSARINELWTQGTLIRTDRTRKTRSGRAASIYVVAA